MANREKILELRPELADFRTKLNVTMRGDVLTYFPNKRCASFSTDAGGFRHSVFDGREYSVADCLRSERCGLVLGASNVFGSGVAGNENVMASLLAERFGFPFANAAMPGANSRNLHGRPADVDPECRGCHHAAPFIPAETSRQLARHLTQ